MRRGGQKCGKGGGHDRRFLAKAKSHGINRVLCLVDVLLLKQEEKN
jgi:hypothetical protein